MTVEAGSALLAPLVNIDTKPVSIAGASADVVADVGLNLPPGISALGVTTVRVTVSIHPQLGTRSFQTGITLVNADPATRYDLGTGQIIVTLGGPLAVLNALDGSTLVANVDVGGLLPGTHVVFPEVTAPLGLTVEALSPPEITLTVTSSGAEASPPATAPPAVP